MLKTEGQRKVPGSWNDAMVSQRHLCPSKLDSKVVWFTLLFVFFSQPLAQCKVCISLSTLTMFLEEDPLISLLTFRIGSILEIKLKEPKQSLCAVTIQTGIFQ